MTERDPKPKRNCVISPVTPPLIRTGSQKLQINASWWPNRGCTSSFKAQGHPHMGKEQHGMQKSLSSTFGTSDILSGLQNH